MEKVIYLRDLQSDDAESLYTLCLDEGLRRSGISYYDSVDDALSVISIWNSV